MQLKQREYVKLIMRHQNRIYRFILALSPNYSEAEEICQQTILTLWEKWEEYDSQSELLPWAFSIARNHFRNHWRKQARRNESVGLADHVLDRVAEVHERRADILEQRREALNDCLNMLDPPKREMVERYYDGDQSVPDLAGRLGCSVDVLYKTLQRVRKSLFDCVNRKLGWEAGA